MSNTGELAKYGIVSPTIVRQPARDGEHVVCAECGFIVNQSKATHLVHVPDIVDAELMQQIGRKLLVFGWHCRHHPYDIVLPAHCEGRNALNLADGWLGVEIRFADDMVRWVATPRREVLG